MSNSARSTTLGGDVISTGPDSISIAGHYPGGILNPQADSIAMGNDIELGLGSDGICIGTSSELGDASDCIAIGHSSLAGATGKPNGIALGLSSSSTGEDSIAIGHSATNSLDHSVVFGDPAVVNLRPSNDGQCDLGSSGASFRNLYVSGGLVGVNVPRSVYSLFPTNPVTVTNTIVMSTVLGPGLGSRTFAPSATQGGTVFQFTGATRANIKDTHAVQFFLVNGPNIGSGPTYTNSSGGDQLGLQLNHTITAYLLGDGNVFVDWVMWSPDLAAPQVFQSPMPIWDPTLANSMDFQVQFSVADVVDQIYCQSMLITQSF